MRDLKGNQESETNWLAIATRLLIGALLSPPVYYLGREYGLSIATLSYGRLDKLVAILNLFAILITIAGVAFVLRNRAIFYNSLIVLMLAVILFEKPFPFRRIDYELEATRMH